MTKEQEELVVNNLNIVESVILRKFKVDIDDDLVQEGRIGLMKAAKTYDESRAKFSTYAYECITKHLLNYFSKQNQECRKPDKPVLSLDYEFNVRQNEMTGSDESSRKRRGSWNEIVDDDSIPLEEIAIDNDAVNEIITILKRIHPDVARYTMLYYGIGTEPHSYKEIGKMEGKSRQAVHHQMKKAMVHVKKELREKGYYDA